MEVALDRPPAVVIPTRRSLRLEAVLLRRARWAACTPFLVLGLVFPTYFARIPSMKAQLQLSDDGLGLLLLVPASSAVLAMHLAGRITAAFGGSAVLKVVTVALPVAMVGLPLAPGPVATGAVLAVVGALDGLVGVGMNAHAVTLERRLGRPILSGCHAVYSLTAVATSAFAALALRASASWPAQVAVIGLVAVLVARFGCRAMLADPVPPPGSLGDPDAGEPVPVPVRARWLAGWTPRVLLLGAMATAVLVGESTVGSWSGVYLHDGLHESLAAASAGYLGFSVLHAGGRLAGDRLTARFGPRTLVHAGTVLAVVGLAAVVAGRTAAPVVLGFAVLGLGLSALLPVILGVAGHEGAALGDTGGARVLARVGAMTYGGMLLGPVVFGGLAARVGVRCGFAGLLLVVAVALVVGGRAIHGEGGPRGRGAADPAARGEAGRGEAGPVTA